MRVEPIEGRLAIRVEPAAARPGGAALERVEQIWAEECARRDPPPFNSRIFSIHDIAGSTLYGAFVEYKWLLAQLRDPSLRGELAVRSLAVSGLLETPQGIVFGQRAPDSAQDGGFWELVPSGGVEAALIERDPRTACGEQILAELQEEVGLVRESVWRPRAFVMVEDEETGVVDVGLYIEARLDAAALLAGFARHRGSEYTALEVVPRDGLDDFLAGHRADLVAVSRLLLEQAPPPPRARR